MAFPHRFGMHQLQASPFISIPYPPLPVVPVVTATHYIVPTIATTVISSGPRLNKKKEQTAEKPPSTTVFVGNIHEKANNDIMRNLLFKCGNIVQWKRVYGSNGRFQAFGFCEFDHPDATLRAIRFLNNLNLGGKKLLIKCDEKTQVAIKEYINKRRVYCGKPVLISEKIEDIPVEEYAWGKDDVTFKSELRQVIQAANEPDLLLEELPNQQSSGFESNATLTSQLILPETEGADKDKLGLIQREIKQFRTTHKDHRIKGRPRSPRSPDEPSSRYQSAADTGVVSKTVDPTTTTSAAPDEPSNRRRRSPSRASSRKPASQFQDETTPSKINAPPASAVSPVSSRASSQVRHLANNRNHKMPARRSRSRDSPRPIKRRSRSRSRSRRRDSEDDDEISDRKRLERKIREKELAYQDRLKKWESRERKKRREYEKEKHAEKQKRKEELREAKKLKEFFEDYDDEVEDPKYYKGKSYEMRRRDYEREVEADVRDRQKEREEMDEIRRKLLSEGVEDPDVEIMRIQKEQEERLLKRLRADSTGSESPLLSTVASSPKVCRPSSPAAGRASTSGASDNEDAASKKQYNSTANNNEAGQNEIVVKPWKSLESSEPTEDGHVIGTPGSDTATPGPTVPSTSGEQQPAAKGASFGFAGLKLTGKGASTAAPLASANEDDDDENSSASKRQRPLVKLEYSEEEKQALLSEADQPLNVNNMTVEEKRKAIKSLIEKIPTNKDELFAYAINWSLVDKILIEKRLKPWVNKKIVEYIGEEEPSLVEFICQKVVEKCPPQSILEDISMVLDEEASVFVIKLWRLLIYEIEAKRYGLVKLD